MTQTYHQANAEQTEAGGCLKFGITFLLFLSAVTMIFVLVASIKPSSPPTASTATGNISIESFDLGFTIPTIDVATAGSYTVTLDLKQHRPYQLVGAVSYVRETCRYCTACGPF